MTDRSDDITPNCQKAARPFVLENQSSYRITQFALAAQSLTPRQFLHKQHKTLQTKNRFARCAFYRDTIQMSDSDTQPNQKKDRAEKMPAPHITGPDVACQKPPGTSFPKVNLWYSQNYCPQKMRRAIKSHSRQRARGLHNQALQTHSIFVFWHSDTEKLPLAPIQIMVQLPEKKKYLTMVLAEGQNAKNGASQNQSVPTAIPTRALTKMRQTTRLLHSALLALCAKKLHHSPKKPRQ